MSAPVLQFPDFSKPFSITTDASGYCAGGVLSQNDKPIAFTSRVFRGSKFKWDTYEKETYVMIHCVNAFRPYVYGTKFTIVTDHRPLLWFKLADLNAKVQKWRFKLSEYDYDIVHTSGKSNVVANAIRRYPPNTTSVNIITRRQERLQEEAEQNTNQIPDNLLDENAAESTEEAEPLNAAVNSNEVSKEKKKRVRPPETKKNIQNKKKNRLKKQKEVKANPQNRTRLLQKMNPKNLSKKLTLRMKMKKS